jgi:hypothetical protein
MSALASAGPLYSTTARSGAQHRSSPAQLDMTDAGHRMRKRGGQLMLLLLLLLPPRPRLVLGTAIGAGAGAADAVAAAAASTQWQIKEMTCGLKCWCVDGANGGRGSRWQQLWHRAPPTLYNI